jgi:hypothetical protein
MERDELNRLLAEIQAQREQALAELHDVTEEEFGLSTTTQPWRWDTLLRVLVQMGNHMREHAMHVRGAREALDRLPTQPQRILAEAETSFGYLRAALVGLTEADLDREFVEGWTIRRILAHVQDSERRYLEAIRIARGRQPEEMEGD